MIELERLCVQVGAFRLDNLSLSVPDGAYAALMGRTGSGKTTVLETICGLREAHSGTIRIRGRDVTRAEPAARNTGYVPQDLSLFPTLTVREHLEFGPRIRKMPSAERASRAHELATLLGIENLLDRLPKGLSGGEAQRVALGRALACKPDVLLLDEPFSALDEETRESMHDLMRRVHKQTGVTVLHITHSTSEARALANPVFRLENGLITG